MKEWIRKEIESISKVVDEDIMALANDSANEKLRNTLNEDYSTLCDAIDYLQPYKEQEYEDYYMSEVYFEIWYRIQCSHRWQEEIKKETVMADGVPF